MIPQGVTLHTPVNDPTKTLVPPAPLSKSEVAVQQGTEFTKEAFGLATYPFFIRGIQHMKNAHGCFAHVQFLGGLFMAVTSPLGLLVNIGAGAATVGGAAYTAGAKTVNVVEKLGRTPDEYRAYLTQEFVKELNAMIGGMSADQKEYFKQHPYALAGIEAVSIAFLSRNQSGEALVVQATIISENDLGDDTCKAYFRELCAIKNTIRKLELGPDEDHAWSVLMDSISNFKSEVSGSSVNGFWQENISEIVQKGQAFCLRAKTDPIFIQKCEVAFK